MQIYQKIEILKISRERIDQRIIIIHNRFVSSLTQD